MTLSYRNRIPRGVSNKTDFACDSRGREARKTGCLSFKLETLYLNVREKKLVINGKEIPYEGLTDFSLIANETGWHLDGKRSIIAEVSEVHL